MAWEMTDSLFSAVRCLECSGQMPAVLFPGVCPHCGSQWFDAEYDYQRLPKDWASVIASRPMTMWRYRELLPFRPEISPVSMWEGGTPLVRAVTLEKKYGNLKIYVKDERREPTGSFKDRQASGTVSALKAQGIKEMVLASTGNAAAAYAAYCSKAGIKLWVFLANNVPSEKLRELALYGAEIIKIAGTYDQAKVIASDFARRRNLAFDQGAKAIPGKEGFKTIAFEIAEQLDWHSPDWYIQAVSGGIGPLGVQKGFRELFNLGLIDKVPKLGIIQAEGCAPMVQAYEQGLEEVEPVIPETLIAVLATGNPGLSYKLLKKLVDTHGGEFISVSDGETFRAMRRMARLEGISMEPASSVAFAGLENLLALGKIKHGETVVVNCSGHTFSAEKHVLEDRFSLHLTPSIAGSEPTLDDLDVALAQLEEQARAVVIIDDNPNDSRIIRRFLQHYKKYRVFDVSNGPDGIDLVQQRKPDLVILDLTLPDMDGFMILERLKTDPATRNIPVIIVSARALAEEEWRFLQTQGVSVWEKGGFRPQELVGHIVRTLGDSWNTGSLRVMPSPSEKFGNSELKRIMIVDTNKRDSRMLHQLLMSRRKFEVLEAHTLKEAIARCNEALPSLIILDDETLSRNEKTTLLNKVSASGPPPFMFLLKSEKDPPDPSEFDLQDVYDSIWTKEVLDRNNLLSRVETLLLE